VGVGGKNLGRYYRKGTATAHKSCGLKDLELDSAKFSNPQTAGHAHDKSDRTVLSFLTPAVYLRGVPWVYLRRSCSATDLELMSLLDMPMAQVRSTREHVSRVICPPCCTVSAGACPFPLSHSQCHSKCPSHCHSHCQPHCHSQCHLPLSIPPPHSHFLNLSATLIVSLSLPLHCLPPTATLPVSPLPLPCPPLPLPWPSLAPPLGPSLCLQVLDMLHISPSHQRLTLLPTLDDDARGGCLRLCDGTRGALGGRQVRSVEESTSAKTCHCHYHCHCTKERPAATIY